MRRLLIVLFLSLPILLSGQLMNRDITPLTEAQRHYLYPYNPTYQKDISWLSRHDNAIKSMALNVASIALQAYGEGLIDRGRYEGNINHMRWGHTIKGAAIGVHLIKPIVLKDMDVVDWGADITAYIMFRGALYDGFYNTGRGIEWAYIGNTSWWDAFWGATRSPSSWTQGAKAMMGVVGISVTFKIG